jgi:aspartyl-tRNA(Asn)/glutamyl-tRNA(Gln) amidotransferase subunit C
MLNQHEIRKIARLSRLRITDEELEKFSDMNQILEMIDKINAVDTKDLKPMAHPMRIKQRLREDVVTEVNQRELLQSIAPNNIEAGLYLTPEVFE